MTLSGCWDYNEIEKIATVLAIGIDKADAPDKYRLTAQIVVPSQISTGGATSQGEQRPANWIVTATGETIFDAVRKLHLQVPRQLFASGMSTLILSEELAREEDLNHILNFFDQDEEPRGSTWFFIAKEARASDIISTSIPISLIIAEGIELFMDQSAQRTGTIPRRNLHELYQLLSAPGIDPVVPQIRRSIEPNPSAEQSRLPQGPMPTWHPQVGGAAVIRGSRLVGWLDNTETRGLLLAQSKVDSAVFVIPCGAGDQGLATVELISSSGKVEPKVEDGKIKAKISVRTIGKLGEWPCQRHANANALNELYAKAVEDEVKLAVDALLKEFKADAFGIGLAVYRKYPSVWKEVSGSWKDILPTLPVEIDVKASVQTVGLVEHPIPIR